MSVQGFEDKKSSFFDKIFRDLRRALNHNPRAARTGERNIQPISQRYGLKDGTQLMEPVFAFVENPEAEIQLGKGGYAAGNRAHLSY
jgi:hypothetical protein